MDFNVFVGNDTVLEYGGLRDGITFQVITDATLEVTINDLAGDPVAGITWPVTLIPVADTDGVYRAVMDKAVAVVAGTDYRAELTIAASGSRDGAFSIPFTAKRREG